MRPIAAIFTMLATALEVAIVKRKSYGESARTWVVDYSEARERAIKWLGDRYLLAKPINASETARRSTPSTDLSSQASG
jgi:hypothetical protein